MNEFELLRQLRELREPVPPSRDLWSGIESRIAQPVRNRAQPRRRRHWPLALAASLVIGVLSSLALVSMRMEPADNTSNAISSAQGDSVRERIERAKLRARSGDLRLAGSEVVLDSAINELESALQQQPDATFLVGLINRTHAQQRRLARHGLNAG